MILPWLIGYLVFSLGPMVASLVLSFTDYPVLTPAKWVGTANYVRMATSDPLYSLSIVNTLVYVGLSIPLSMMIGIGGALLLNQKIPGTPVFRTFFYMPSILPAVATVALFMWILHPQFGLVNTSLRAIGIRGPAWLVSPVWAKPALVLWSLWHSGTAMIIFLAGLQAIPEHLYEAAAIDGAGVWRKFVHVTIPMLSSTIFFQLVMSVIGSFQIFTAAVLLGRMAITMPGTIEANVAGPGNALLFYVVYIYQNGFIFLKMGYGSAMAWVLFLVVLGLTLIQFRLAGRWVYYEAEAES
jgi:multiple sugar transport system permease protein